MGWNPWNAFRTEVTEAKIMGVVEALKRTGLADAGYRFIDVDDGWWLKRDAQHRLVVRTKMFPSAAMADGNTSLRPFVDRLHAMGLFAGLYTDIGRNVCSQAWDPASPNLPVGSVPNREVGSLDYTGQDMQLIFGDWGFDALKVDACGVADFGPEQAWVKSRLYRALGPYIVRGKTTPEESTRVRDLYLSLRSAIEQVRPRQDYALAVCTWGEAGVAGWGKEVGRSWRTSPDIEPTWASMLANFDTAASNPSASSLGHYNDPDMLEIGNGDFDESHMEAARTHLSLWAMLNAPLILGSDLTLWSPELIALAGNREVIALDQDPLAKQARVVERAGDGEILVKELSGGAEAVALINRGDTPLDLAVPIPVLRLPKKLMVRNLWNGMESSSMQTSVRLAPRQTVLLRIRAVSPR